MVRLKPDSTYGRLPDPTYAEPSLFASSMEEPRRRGGFSIWLAAAGSLVLGIVIGFASGYRAGQGTGSAAAVTESGPSSPTPTSGASSPGQTFSESDVSDPVRLNPEPIVPAPDVSPRSARPAAPEARPAAKPVPAPPAPAPARRQPAPAAAEQKTPVPPAPVGPGSLEVVSRPAGAQVFLDGRVVGRTPLSIADVATGSHSIRLELPGFNGWATTVDVRAGSPVRVAASLEQ